MSGRVPPSSQPRQRTWRLPTPLRDETRLSKAAMHPGGQERALQPQTTATELEPQPVVTARQADERRGEGRGGEVSLRLRSVGYQLSVEPGSCAHPCRHRMGHDLVWVPLGCLCPSPVPPLALPRPTPTLFQISVLKGSVPPTSPHGPPSSPSSRIIASLSTGKTNFQNHFLNTLPSDLHNHSQGGQQQGEGDTEALRWGATCL